MIYSHSIIGDYCIESLLLCSVLVPKEDDSLCVVVVGEGGELEVESVGHLNF